jgi:hypothetical protein
LPDNVVEGPDAGDMVATEPGVLVQLTARSVTTLPLTSLIVAVRVFVLAAPEFVTESTAGTTVTFPTGAFIDTSVFDPLFPSLVAVTCVVPEATAVTSPVASTAATPAFVTCHVTTRPVRMPPIESFVTAASWVV